MTITKKVLTIAFVAGAAVSCDHVAKSEKIAADRIAKEAAEKKAAHGKRVAEAFAVVGMDTVKATTGTIVLQNHGDPTKIKETTYQLKSKDTTDKTEYMGNYIEQSGAEGIQSSGVRAVGPMRLKK